MATSIAAPNLQRVPTIDFEFSYDSNGIISIIDDLVERVMSAHMKKALIEMPLESAVPTLRPDPTAEEVAA